MELKYSLPIFLFISLFFFGHYLVSSESKNYTFGNYTELELNQTCNNLDLEETVNCLIQFEQGFYKYKETTNLIELDLNYLKENGGDCLDYAKWTSKVLTNFGFYSNVIKFPMNEDQRIGHALSYATDGKTICYVEQQAFFCSKFVPQTN